MYSLNYHPHPYSAAKTFFPQEYNFPNTFLNCVFKCHLDVPHDLRSNSLELCSKSKQYSHLPL